MDQRRPRLVLVTRRTPLELLLERHGTPGQARFYLESRGQDVTPYCEGHERFHAGLQRVFEALPAERRRVRVDRESLDRFLFAPDDVVLMVGQDGLVANTARYLQGQLAIGINPDPERYDGILSPHPPSRVPGLLGWLDRPGPEFVVERRAMVSARREDGQVVLGLNEVFIGHRSHQSARYRLTTGGRTERQSSSGLICATGTGATGWARSIARQRVAPPEPPRPDEPRFVWFAREPFPSVATGHELEQGTLGPEEALDLVSEMGEGGVAFADGMEGDYVEFLDGQTLSVGLHDQPLRLVMPGSTTEDRPPPRG